MPLQPDTRYAPQNFDYGYVYPWSSNEERLTSQALAAANIPGEVIRERTRPPLDQIQMFPPRFGYREKALGISDLVDLDSRYQRVDYSGRTSGYSGTSYPSLNQF